MQLDSVCSQGRAQSNATKQSLPYRHRIKPPGGVITESGRTPALLHSLVGDARAFAGRAGGGGVAEQVVDVILQLRPAHFPFVNLLVGGEIYLLFDAIDFVVEPVVFVVNVAKVFVSP